MRYQELMESKSTYSYSALVSKHPELVSDLDAVGKWLKMDPTSLQFTVATEPMSKFAPLVADLLATYEQFPKEAARTKKIMRLLKSGAEPLPIFCDSVDGFVMEGRHRIVAFNLLGYATVSVVRAIVN